MAEYIKATGFDGAFNVGEYWADLKCAPALPAMLSLAGLAVLLDLREGRLRHGLQCCNELS